MAESSWLDELCPITLTPFREIKDDIMLLQCMHRFDRRAIINHLSRGNRFCPVCKLVVNPLDYGVEVIKEIKSDNSDDSDGYTLGSHDSYVESDGSDNSIGSLANFIINDSISSDDDYIEIHSSSSEDETNSNCEEGENIYGEDNTYGEDN